MIISGKTLILGDNINTDEIIPGRFLSEIPINQLGTYAFADTIPDFQKQIKTTSIIVAGTNFGCGSSREQAVFALKHAGVTAIISPSFARIFFRNCINNGLPVIETFQPINNYHQNDTITITLKTGEICNQSTKASEHFTPLPDWMIDIIEAGGHIPWIQKTQPFIGTNKSKQP